MKKKSVDDQLQELILKVNDTITRWKSYKENGGTDPFYPDGVNMNLLRNHLIHYKREIRELCAENNVSLQGEAFFPNLPYTDENYFAKPESERAKYIMSKPCWRCCNHECPEGEYDESILTFI